MVYMESALPQGLPRYGTAPEGSDHGHMVRAYQLPTRATGRDLQPLQRRDHCPFTLLTEMAEHTYGDARREWPKVELPAPTLVVSYSPATLSSVYLTYITHPPLYIYISKFSLHNCISYQEVKELTSTKSTTRAHLVYYGSSPLWFRSCFSCTQISL